MVAPSTRVPHPPAQVEPQKIQPVREVDGVKVFVHTYDPKPNDVARFDEWWRGLIGRRLPK